MANNSTIAVKFEKVSRYYGEIKAVESSGTWMDVVYPWDILRVNDLAMTFSGKKMAGKIEQNVIVIGDVQIGKNTVIRGNTYIRGPVIIGGGCIIKDSYIGPFTSIGDQVEIYGAEIENSIIFENADIHCDKRITDSLIGMNALIVPVHETLPSGHKLLIGDNSQVEL